MTPYFMEGRRGLSSRYYPWKHDVVQEKRGADTRCLKRLRSILTNDLGPRGSERTGTVLFMVLDYLTDEGRRGEVKHIYRHDLKSFMWVFAWIFLRSFQERGLRLAESRHFDGWTTLDAATCRTKKFYLLNSLKTSAHSDIDPLMRSHCGLFWGT